MATAPAGLRILTLIDEPPVRIDRVLNIAVPDKNVSAQSKPSDFYESTTSAKFDGVLHESGLQLTQFNLTSYKGGLVDKSIYPREGIDGQLYLRAWGYLQWQPHWTLWLVETKCKTTKVLVVARTNDENLKLKELKKGLTKVTRVIAGEVGLSYKDTSGKIIHASADYARYKNAWHTLTFLGKVSTNDFYWDCVERKQDKDKK